MSISVYRLIEIGYFIFEDIKLRDYFSWKRFASFIQKLWKSKYIIYPLGQKGLIVTLKTWKQTVFQILM